MQKSFWLAISSKDENGVQRQYVESIELGMDSHRLLIARMRRHISSALFTIGVDEANAESIAAELYDGAAENREHEIAPSLMASVYPCDPASGVNYDQGSREPIGE